MRPVGYILYFLLFVFAGCNVSHKLQSDKNALSPGKKMAITNMYVDACKEKILGNFSEAGKLFEECLKNDPNNASAMYELSGLKFQEKNYDAALKLAEKAVALEPDNKWYLLQLARIYKQKKFYTKETEIYSRLVQTDPYNVQYYDDWAMAYIYAGKSDEAIRVYNLAEKKIGITENFSLRKKEIYTITNRTEKAIHEIENLIDKFPSNTKYYELLAELYMKNKNYNKALTVFQKIVEINPSNEYIHLSLADYYRVIGNKEEWYNHLKLAFVNPMLNIDPKISILYSYFQLTETHSEYKKQAFELCKILADVHPDEPKVHSIYADFLFREKKYLEARDEFRKVNALDNSKYIVWEQLLLCESEIKDFQAMSEESEKAIEIFPEQPALYLFNGSSHYQLKQYSKAVEAFNHGKDLVIDNKPLLIQFYSNLGDVYFQMKQMSKSDSSFEKVLTLDSTNTYVLNNYGYYLSERETRLEYAEKLARRANELKPNDPAYLDTYGWILYKLNKFDEAKKWIDQALGSGGDKDAIILEHCGDVLYNLGQVPVAIDYWKKAKQTGKGTDLLDKKIEDKTLYR